MPGRGDVTCPICYDNLLNSLDDLDETIPAVVTQCGESNPTLKSPYALSDADLYKGTAFINPVWNSGSSPKRLNMSR